MTEPDMNLDDSKLNERSNNTENEISEFNRNIFWEHSEWEQSLVQPLIKSKVALFQIEVKYLVWVDISKYSIHYDEGFNSQKSLEFHLIFVLEPPSTERVFA